MVCGSDAHVLHSQSPCFTRSNWNLQCQKCGGVAVSSKSLSSWINIVYLASARQRDVSCGQGSWKLLVQPMPFKWLPLSFVVHETVLSTERTFWCVTAMLMRSFFWLWCMAECMVKWYSVPTRLQAHCDQEVGRCWKPHSGFLLWKWAPVTRTKCKILHMTLLVCLYLMSPSGWHTKKLERYRED